LKNVKIICIIGVDGSGKTSHAKRLTSSLKGLARARGKIKYLWFGSAYFFSYPFMALCRVLGLTSVFHIAHDYEYTEHQYYKNKPIAFLWTWIQFVDTFMFVVSRISIALTFRYKLILDRFVHDILVDLMVDIGRPDLYRALVGRLMLALVPDGTITFLFDVDENTSFRRKLDIPDRKYIAVRRQHYRSIAQYLGILEIDSSIAFDDVHEKLIAEVRQRCIEF
jgi:thymidylate kinase